METGETGQRRRAIRLKVRPLDGEVAIERIRNVPVDSRAKRILLVDMSPNGLRFISDLRFPVTKQLVLKICTRLIGQIRVELSGRLVWRQALDNLYEYGMELEITDSQAALLRRLLNDLLQEMSPRHKEIHRLYRRTSAIQQFNSIGENREWN